MVTTLLHRLQRSANTGQMRDRPLHRVCGYVGIWVWLAVAAAATLVARPAPVDALEIEFSARRVKRDVLALYDSRRETKPHLTRIHKFAEMPLNYLGYRVVYQDVNAALPDPASLSGYRGILSWLVEPLRRPEALVSWLDRATGSGLKLVVLGDLAPPESGWLLPAINRVLARIGLEHTGEYVDLTWRSQVTEQNAEMIGFERPVDKALPGFPVLRIKRSEIEQHLVIESPDAGGTRRGSTVVATSPGGGFAAHNFTVFYEPNTDRVLWTLNPFAFFKKSFGAERFPVPDPTTLDGRRIYFSHIDGDGWNNISEIEGYREAQRLSAEVVAREAIIPYPDLPVTVGVIAGDIELELGGNPLGRAVARQLFDLPQVEVGSHTYSHPYDWQFFEHYDRAAEMAKIEAYQPPDQTARERFTRGVLKLAKKELPADRFDKYVAGTDDLPRTYLRRPFDLDLEVAGALRVSQGLAPAGKPARIYLWSGDTTPFPAAIRAARRAGARNINGGDSRLDREYPSVTYVPPLSRPAGGERQIYAGSSNENTYTNDWTGPYYGFFMLEHTLKNTELPRRLKPFNLYYHMYSGEKASALASILHFLDMARRDPVIPVPASQYAEIADDFFAAQIEQIDLFSWSITGRGALQTVRFDAAAGLDVDIHASQGVLGSNRHAGALYVALDPATPRALVTLKSRVGQAPDGPVPAVAAALVESRWQISDLRRQGCGFTAAGQGFGAGEMVWHVAPGKTFTITAEGRGARKNDTQGTWQQTATATAAGKLSVRITASAVQPLSLGFACHD